MGSAENGDGTNFADHGISLHAPGATDEQIIPITGCFETSGYRPRSGIGFISHPTADPIESYAGEIGFYTRDAADGSGLGSGDEKVRISRSGRLGIGTKDPNRLLHLEGSSSAIIRLTDTDTSGEDDSIIGMVEFETLDSNNPGVAANVRAELTDTTNGASALMFSTGTPTTIGTMMEITSSGLVKANRNLCVQGNASAASSSSEYTQVFYTTISSGSSKTFTFSGLTTGWADIDIGGYAASGQAACHFAVKFGGYMTQTYTWNVAVLAEWTRNTTFSKTQNASNYALVVTNNASSQTQIFQICCRSSSSGFTCAFS